MNRLITYILPIAILATIVLTSSPGVAGPLPPLIDFQSLLLDEGGNLLPSGTTAIQFQILDENRIPIYTETQSVDVVKGAASALIGNGADAKGITTGGVPDDIFATGAPRYLQVQVEGHAAEDPMTIVPVPYAQWSQTCATVADGAVTPASIAKAAVGFESLAPDVVGKLAAEMSKSQGVVTMQSLSSSGGATQVGVDAKLINSGSASVQGALQDIDLAVKKRQEETTFLTEKLNEEVTNSTNAVAGVQSKLDQEVTDRGVAVSNEASARFLEDKSLKETIAPITETLKNIYKIPGKLNVDQTSAAASDLNMGENKIIGLADPVKPNDAATKNYVYVADTALQKNIDTISTTIGNINNIPGVLDPSKLPPVASMSPVPPVLSGEVKANEFTSGMKFIPFMPEELAQSTCGDNSGHVCVTATMPADNKLYYCKLGVKFSPAAHNFPSDQQPFPTCEYTVIAKVSSINDGDGPNLDMALQRGVVVRFLNSNANPFESILYNVYEIPVATQ